MEEIRMPLSLADGASLAPFHKQRFEDTLKRGDKYTCGASVFFSNPLRDASPGVPIDTKQVENYMAHYFMDVDNIARLPHVEIGCEVGGGDMLRTSPCEPIHALLFGDCRESMRTRYGCQPVHCCAGDYLEVEECVAELAHNHRRSRHRRIRKVFCFGAMRLLTLPCWAGNLSSGQQRS
eukprot:NODE_2357_length_951_cov_2.802455.p1 GENE.NODE_2357_length_951_cov_2.802455~~NODE_2357_length_951_cov_2.802455.p1  ORF type:complete len:179 (-),score=22.96 NODE_2357_length_951_cov_2.802455:149-685(-)